jgi:hypothetical protein
VEFDFLVVAGSSNICKAGDYKDDYQPHHEIVRALSLQAFAGALGLCPEQCE